MEGNRVVREIATTAQAIEFFGAEHVRRHDGSLPEPSEAYGLGYCLCPIDKDRLLAAHGYRRIPTDDPRWDPFDTRIEKIESEDAS